MKNSDSAFALGEEIRISRSHSWAQGASGTIAQPPEAIRTRFEGWGDDGRKELLTPRGMKCFYWVKFKQAYVDADGDGPYEEAAIESKYIERL